MSSTKMPSFISWSPEAPRLVTVWLDTVDAARVPFDDIEGFALAYVYDSPYGVNGEIQVWTPTGVVEAKPGEWIVYIGKIGPAGEERETYIVMPDDVFRSEFKPMNHNAEMMLNGGANE